VRTIFALMAVLAFGVVLLGASPVYADLQDDVDQAATIIERFQAVPEKAIPQAVLKDAKGLAIMTVMGGWEHWNREPA
jgi:SH3 domain-containing YSC84-like protein 1